MHPEDLDRYARARTLTPCTAYETTMRFNIGF